MKTDEVLSQLEYTNNKNDKVKIIGGNAGLLKVFKQYVADQANQGNIIEEDDLVTITKKTSMHSESGMQTTPLLHQSQLLLHSF